MTVCRSWAFQALPLLLLAVAACNNSSSAPATSSGPAGTAIFIQTGWSDPWSKMYEKMLEPAVKGVAGQVTFQEVSADGDPKKQIQDINDAIAKKPNVLMVSPIDTSVLPALAKAKKAGIFVFQLDRCYVSWLYKDTPADSYYGADVVGVGSCGLFQYVHMMNLKGTALVLPDSSSETGRELLKGIKFNLKKYHSDVKGVMGSDCGTDQAKAKAFVAAYLKSGKPVDVILTQNEPATLGAAEAVKEAGVKKYIFGIGGYTRKMIDAIKDGSVYAVFTIPPGGPSAVQEVPAAFQHQRVPRNSFVPFDMVMKRNVDQYLKDHPTLGD